MIHRIYSLPNTKKKSKMSQSRIGANSNSFYNNSNSFNNINSLNNSIIFNNTTSFKNVSNVNNFGNAHEKTEIIAWLSPLEPRIRHEDIRAHHVKHVGDWLFQTEEYQNWFNGIRGGESDNSALFCYGDPGVGKTYIT